MNYQNVYQILKKKLYIVLDFVLYYIILYLGCKCTLRIFNYEEKQCYLFVYLFNDIFSVI